MRGSPKSGARKRKAVVSLVGNKYGRLTVTEFSHYDSRDCAHWKCLCECGNYKAIRGDRIKDGRAQSCGCRQKEIIANVGHNNKIHGFCGTDLYTIWGLIIQRCENPSNPNYPEYGARGIKVCSGIRASVEGLIKAIGERPDRSFSVDRKDNNKGYECGICAECIAEKKEKNIRWATRSEQARNKRSTIMVEVDGVRVPLIEWCEKRGIDHKIARSRLAIGWPLDRLGNPKHERLSRAG